jgi:hypothetical protein
MLSLFIEKDVEFLLVGGYALAIHGFPEGVSGDIEIFVKPSRQNAERVYSALAGAKANARTIRRDLMCCIIDSIILLRDRS